MALRVKRVHYHGMIAKRGYHTMVVEQIGILTRRSRVAREARSLATNMQSNEDKDMRNDNDIKQHRYTTLHYSKVFPVFRIAIIFTRILK